MNQIKIENVEFEKDTGVKFVNELQFDRHTTEKTSGSSMIIDTHSTVWSHPLSIPNLGLDT